MNWNSTFCVENDDVKCAQIVLLFVKNIRVFIEEGLPEHGSVSDLALFIQNFFVFGKTNVFWEIISFDFIPSWIWEGGII